MRDLQVAVTDVLVADHGVAVGPDRERRIGADTRRRVDRANGLVRAGARRSLQRATFRSAFMKS